MDARQSRASWASKNLDVQNTCGQPLTSYISISGLYTFFRSNGRSHQEPNHAVNKGIAVKPSYHLQVHVEKRGIAPVTADHLPPASLEGVLVVDNCVVVTMLAQTVIDKKDIKEVELRCLILLIGRRRKLPR